MAKRGALVASAAAALERADEDNDKAEPKEPVEKGPAAPPGQGRSKAALKRMKRAQARDAALAKAATGDDGDDGAGPQSAEADPEEGWVDQGPEQAKKAKRGPKKDQQADKRWVAKGVSAAQAEQAVAERKAEKKAAQKAALQKAAEFLKQSKKKKAAGGNTPAVVAAANAQGKKKGERDEILQSDEAVAQGGKGELTDRQKKRATFHKERKQKKKLKRTRPGDGDDSDDDRPLPNRRFNPSEQVGQRPPERIADIMAKSERFLHPVSSAFGAGNGRHAVLKRDGNSAW